MASKHRSDGDGSVHYDTTRGRWVGVYVTGWRDGKPIRRKVVAKSKSAAASRLRELRQQVEVGQLPSGRIPTVGEWATYWLDEIAAKKVRPSTLRGYRTYVTCYIVPLLGDKRLDRLTPEHISKAWTYMQETGRPGVAAPRPLSPTSAHQAHRILSRALHVAYQRGHVTRNVATMLDAPQPVEHDVVFLEEDEARRVLDAASESRHPARWRIALALGLRQGEALGLCWDYVDLEAGTLSVRWALGRVKGKGLVLSPPKSKKSRRTIRLPAVLLAELRAHRTRQTTERLAAGSWWTDGEHGGFVFARPDGRPIDPKADWSEWKALLQTAAVPDIRLHDGRHTAATMLAAMGVDLPTMQEILGHSRITQTMVYTHVVSRLHNEAAEKMDAFWA